jgi:hypothetical protein
MEISEVPSAQLEVSNYLGNLHPDYRPVTNAIKDELLSDG